MQRFLRGFTITELLVVIGIITLLLGLMFPALSSVRTMSMATQSQGNLRNMAVAAQVYANVYQRYPVMLRYESTDDDFLEVSWDWITSWFTGEVIGPGPLWAFTDDPGAVMQCPAHEGQSNTVNDPYTGYNYSPYIGGEEGFSTSPNWSKVRGGTRPHNVRRANTCAMFGLGGYRGGTNKYMRSPLHSQHSDILLGPQTIYSGGQAFRYQRMTFIAYADGHVGSSGRPKPGLNATDTLLSKHMDYPRNGFLSDDHAAYAP